MTMDFSTLGNPGILPALTAMVVSIAVTVTALWRAGGARREAHDAHAAATMLALRVDFLEKTLTGHTARIDELLAERNHTATASSRPGLREAVALSRHGASTEELISTCRIGRNEARLIQMLYGAARDTAAPADSADVH
jgi:Protein of unknown function (DUF2802)